MPLVFRDAARRPLIEDDVMPNIQALNEPGRIWNAVPDWAQIDLRAAEAFLGHRYVENGEPVPPPAGGWLVQNGEVEVAPPAPKKRDYLPNGSILWDKIISDVREIYELDALVAGGAVRDHLLGVRPKDVDVFVNGKPDLARDRAEELGYGEAINIFNEGYEKGAFDAFTCIQVWPSFSEYPVQLIFKPYENLNDLVSSFDLDICKSSYYNGSIEDTEPAERDRKAKTITFTGKGSEKKSLRRAERIKKHLSSQGQDFRVNFPKKKEDAKANLEKAIKQKYAEAKMRWDIEAKERW